MDNYLFLDFENAAECAAYETFVSEHGQSNFMQSLMWTKVKTDWEPAVILSKNHTGEIVGSMLVLMRKIPLFGVRMLYAPRGPVLRLDDKETLFVLMNGMRALAKKKRAYIFKCDPDVLYTKSDFIETMEEAGLVHHAGGVNFEEIQPRFNYRLYFRGRSRDEVFADFQKKTRYNTRLAERKGVTVKIAGKEGLDDFIRLMEITGERDGFQVRSKAYFENMLDAMGKHARLYLAYYEGEAVSGAITTQYGGKTCYVYGASDNAHRNVMPNYLMQWEMILWAYENGDVLYDFQGVSGDLSEDNPLYGLYRFKRGFSGDLDELVGEFHLVFKPILNRIITYALSLREKLSAKKQKKHVS